MESRNAVSISNSTEILVLGGCTGVQHLEISCHDEIRSMAKWYKISTRLHWLHRLLRLQVGKTAILQELRAVGEQILDLEVTFLMISSIWVQKGCFLGVLKENILSKICES